MNDSLDRRAIRSYLYAPGSEARLLQKVWAAGADAVVLDLEDAVAPDRKGEARALVAEALAVSRVLVPRPVAFVRINAVETPHWRLDLEAVVQPGLDGVRLAKCESADDVREVAEALDALERDRGLPVGRLGIVPTVESARAVLDSLAIARAPRVRALSFGATDFLKDIGVAPDGDEEATFAARSQLVLASRAARIAPPIASVHTRLNDESGLRASTLAARRLGFFGRSCIHPTQLAVVHAVFTPTAAEIAAARTLVQQAAGAGAAGRGAFRLPDGQFVDRAVVDRAVSVLALAGESVEAPDGSQEAR